MRQGRLRHGSDPGGAAVAGAGRQARRWARASSSSSSSGGEAARGMAAGVGAAPLRAPAGRKGGDGRRDGWMDGGGGRPAAPYPPFPGQRAGGDWAGRSRPPRPAGGSRPPSAPPGPGLQRRGAGRADAGQREPSARPDLLLLLLLRRRRHGVGGGERPWVQRTSL